MDTNLVKIDATPAEIRKDLGQWRAWAICANLVLVAEKGVPSDRELQDGLSYLAAEARTWDRQIRRIIGVPDDEVLTQHALFLRLCAYLGIEPPQP